MRASSFSTAPTFALCLLAAGLSCRQERAKPTTEGANAPAASIAPSPPARARSAASGPRVYVSNEDSNDITVIDSSTDEVTGTIFVGKRPRGIRLSPDGNTLLVALSGSPKDPPG